MKNTMTLRQLRAILPSTKGIDTPSEIWVAQHPDQILCTTTMSDAVINVYQNGFYTYIKGGRTSILRVDGFSYIRVESDDPILEETYIDSPYAVALHLNGDHQWERNADRRNTYHHDLFLNNDDSDWCEGSSVASAEDEYLEKEERREEHEWLREALKALSKQQRIVVLLHYKGSLTQEQIAAKLGLKRRTVRGHLADGIKNLKKKINGKHPPLIPYFSVLSERAKIRSCQESEE